MECTTKYEVKQFRHAIVLAKLNSILFCRTAQIKRKKNLGQVLYGCGSKNRYVMMSQAGGHIYSSFFF